MENKQVVNYSEQEVMEMLDDTSKLIAKERASNLSSSFAAAQNSTVLTNDVEFFKWMAQNYRQSTIFNSNSNMLNYINKGAGKEAWFAKQIQGKGYEWDWMTAQRNSIRNITKVYDAGDVANRAASDVTVKDILTGKSYEAQMKAYVSKTNPDLKTTPQDMKVVTNAEKTGIVSKNGYKDVESFQDAKTIQKNVDNRMQKIKDGKATPTYNFKNVAGTMVKSGLIACAFGVTIETIASYKLWKSGQLTDSEYLKEIAKAGGDAGLTGFATSGIMIPVSAAITAAGVSNLLTIPIAFVVSAGINKIIAPCFGRGDYKKYLNEAKYYQSLEDIYDGLVMSMEQSANQFGEFITQFAYQCNTYQLLSEKNEEINKDLIDLYNSI